MFKFTDQQARAQIIAAYITVAGAILVASIAGIFAFQTNSAKQKSDVTATAFVAQSDATELSLVNTVQAPTFTPLPSQTPYPTYTAQPTYTPNPTYTARPNPTNTTFPTPTEVALFFDDFTDGKSELWQTQFGDPIIVDNALNFSATTLMIIDAKDWINYEVSFDVSNMSCQGGVGSSGVSVGLRLQNTNNMAALRIFYWGDNCTGTWYVIKNGEWQKIPNSSFNLPPKDSQGKRHFVISVDGNTYNCPFGVPLVIEGFPSGGVALWADKGVVVDNFKIIPHAP